MKRLVVLGVAALTAFGFVAMGCSSDSKPAATGSGGSGNEGGAGTTGGATSASTAKTGGTTSTSTATNGGSTSASTSAACGTTNGTYAESTTFATAASTAPYSLNPYNGFTATNSSLTQTTTGPTGLDCSAGCAKVTLTLESGMAAYAGAQFVEFFGAAATDVKNLLNETVTMKIAVDVTMASGATAATVPVTVSMFGQDTYVDPDNTGVRNIWIKDLGTTASLAASAGWHTVTYKVVDVNVPSWSPVRYVCGSALHDLGIVVQNGGTAITAADAGTITLYVQSVAVAP